MVKVDFTYIMKANYVFSRQRIDCFEGMDSDEPSRDFKAAVALWQSCVPLNDVPEDEMNSLLAAFNIQVNF